MARIIDFTGGQRQAPLRVDQIRSLQLSELLRGRNGLNRPILSGGQLGVELTSEALKDFALAKERQTQQEREDAAGANIEKAFQSRLNPGFSLEFPENQPAGEIPATSERFAQQLPQEEFGPLSKRLSLAREMNQDTQNSLAGQRPIANLANSGAERARQDRGVAPIAGPPTQEESANILIQNKDNRGAGVNLLSQALAAKQAEQQAAAQNQIGLNNALTIEAFKAQNRPKVPGRDVPFRQDVIDQQLALNESTTVPKPPIPGRDVPFDDEVLSQKIDIAKAGAANLNPLEQAKLSKLNQDEKQFLVKSKGALSQFESKTNTVAGSIDTAISLIEKGGPFGVGTAGLANVFSGLPESDARTLNNTIDTIKANVGFDNLQQMRDNSPTGGALGQVSENENKLLQAISGSLDPKQDPKVLVKNLQNIKTLYQNVLKEKKGAFNETFDVAPERNRRATDKEIVVDF